MNHMSTATSMMKGHNKNIPMAILIKGHDHADIEDGVHGEAYT